LLSEKTEKKKLIHSFVIRSMSNKTLNKALDTFDSGKTPGNDGIPAEFY